MSVESEQEILIREIMEAGKKRAEILDNIKSLMEENIKNYYNLAVLVDGYHSAQYSDEHIKQYEGKVWSSSCKIANAMISHEVGVTFVDITYEDGNYEEIPIKYLLSNGPDIIKMRKQEEKKQKEAEEYQVYLQLKEKYELNFQCDC